MKLRSLLPVAVTSCFLLASGFLTIARLSAAPGSLQPPPHTTLDDIDVATLSVGCPPLAHEPWRGRLQTIHEDQMVLSTFALMADEPLAITGEAFSRRGGSHHPQTRFSLSALPLDPDDEAVTKTLLSREFRWFVHQDKQRLFYYEQPSADGKDAIVGVDRTTLAEKRWTLPLIPPPAGLTHPPTYSISCAGTTIDGKLIVQIYTGEWGAGDPAFPPQVHSGLCVIDPQMPASTTPPPFVIVPDLLPIAMSWPTGPNEILALAAYPKQQKRLLINVATGAVREVAPTEPKFRGYGEFPPRIAKDRALNDFVKATNTGDGSQEVYVDGLTVFGTAAVRLGMPSSELVPQGAPSVQEAGTDAVRQWQFFAGAPRCTTPVSNGIGRFSLSPATRDLALITSRHSLQTPFTIEALNASTVLLTQIILPQVGATDPAVRDGCLRLIVLTPSTGIETLVGTIALPDAINDLPGRIALQCAREGDSLLITLGSEREMASSMLGGRGLIEQGEFWTRLPWPKGFPNDVPDGWLGNITPRPGTPIP